MPRSMSLRDAANGRPCLVRFASCQDGPDHDATVLAHLRRANVAGVSQKPNDLCAVLACSACHDVIDARIADDSWLDSLLLEALVRTLDYWHQNGTLFTNDAGELRWRPHDGLTL